MTYSRQNPSPRFRQLVEQYRAMHQVGNPVKGIAPGDMFPGQSLPRHARHIKNLIAHTGARTILDYGSGKGAQYLPREVRAKDGRTWNSIQEYWGVATIRCYDPGYEPYSRFPEGRFDGVVSTDVLEHCPEEDVSWIVEELFGFARRFVYANVACYPAAKTLPSGENAHCTVRPAPYWQALFEATAARHPGILWELRADVRSAEGGKAEVRYANFPPPAPQPARSAQRPEDAVESLRARIASNPAAPALHAQLGNALSELGRLEEAEASLRTAVGLDPGRAESYNDYGLVLLKQGRVDEAMANYQKALRCRPEFAPARNNIGALLKDQRRYREAIASLAKAVEIDPALVQAHVNLGGCHHQEGNFKAALRAYEAALAHRPALSGPRLSKGLIHLLLGEFAEGWRDYCPTNAQSSSGIAFSAVDAPLPKQLAGARILLVKNQGIGDEVFFSRFVPELRARGASVAYLTEPRSADLFRRSGLFDEVLQATSPTPRADFIFPIDRLPFLLETNDASPLPASIRIPVLPDAQRHVEAMLASTGPGPYLGVTWRAGLASDSPLRRASTDTFLQKEIPLRELAPCLREWRGEITVLQRNPRAEELEELGRLTGRRIHDFSGVSSQLEHTLAVVRQIDEYVTVSNTNVHLRAAGGKSSRVLVPFPPEWRWMQSGAESPWFPASCVYRQEQSGDWSQALARLRADLGPGT